MSTKNPDTATAKSNDSVTRAESKQHDSNDDSDNETNADNNTDADQSARDLDANNDENDSNDDDSNDNDSNGDDSSNSDSNKDEDDQGSNGDDEEDSSDEESNSSDEDMDEVIPVEEGKVQEVVVKKKRSFFSRSTTKAKIESSSSSSSESEDSIDLDDLDVETLEEAIESLKLVEEVDSDWDILLDAPSDWDSDDSENKPTAPVFRSTCGYLTMETTQLREDLLNDLLESRVLLVDAEKELKKVEEDQYMKYYFDTIAKLQNARDKAAKRVNDEESRLALYSQKDEGITQLASALRFNEHLMSLTLCDAEMTSASAISLASAVKVHPTLTHLSCKHNPIGAIGAEALFRASRRNGVGGLKELDLWDCNIGPEGALLIATQLYKDTTLIDVRLRYNQFGPIGGYAFAGCLMQNRTLQKLDLSLNDIGMNGALAFERVLKFTVAVDMERGIKMLPYKKLCKLGGSRMNDPFWEDEFLKRKAAQEKKEKKARKLAAKAAKAAAKKRKKNLSLTEKLTEKMKESKLGGELEGQNGSEDGSGDDEEVEEEEEEEGAEEEEEEEEEAEEEEEEEQGGNGESKGEGETKTGKPRREGRRARRKRLKQEAVRAKRIEANNKFWMFSYLCTKEDLDEQKKLLFSTKTKKNIYSLVLFAGTEAQCSRAIELMDGDFFGDSEAHLTLAKPNFFVKEINLRYNNFERPFRNNIKHMKRLLGSRIVGVWQPVADFFKPTLRA